MMAGPTKNAECENRISEEIIVDANGSEEQAMGWYYYLQDILHHFIFWVLSALLSMLRSRSAAAAISRLTGIRRQQ